MTVYLTRPPVDRRNEPINVMANIGAAALRMMAENPALRQQAQAMRTQAEAFGRVVPVGMR